VSHGRFMFILRYGDKFFQSAFTFYIPTTMYESSYFILTTLGMTSLCDFSYPNVCVVLFTMVLTLISLMTNDVEHLLTCSLPSKRLIAARCLLRSVAHFYLGSLFT
jgi:hypothetical protein